MAWTSPRTWVALEALTASLFNTHIRDNLIALDARTTDTGWVTTGFTAATGWTLTGARYRMIGAYLVSLSLDLTRSGADIAAGSTGNITDTDMATIPAAIKPTNQQFCAFQSGGVTDGSASIDVTTGIVTLQSLSSNGTITTTSIVHIDTTYML